MTLDASPILPYLRGARNGPGFTGAERGRDRPVTRRHLKEFRPAEALSLISADRNGKRAPCPSCGSDTVERTPARNADQSNGGRVQLGCESCGRVVAYIDRAATTPAGLR